MGKHISFALVLFASFLHAKTEVYFSPSPDCENHLVSAISGAKSEIQAAVYSINNRKLVDALVAAHQRGVKLRILTDSVQASQRTSGIWDLLAGGVPLRLHSKFKIEHNKFAVFDHKRASTGSFNWTGPAARSNSENCLFLDDADTVAKYSARFEELWQKNTEAGSQARLQKLQNRTIAHKTKNARH